MDLSIVICTHNRAELLAETLASLNRAQRPVGHSTEVVVVANGCNDATIPMLEQYVARQPESGNLPLRCFEEPRLGKSHALNHAIGLNLAPLIAFIDDDQTVSPGFLVAALAAASGFPEADFFCGKILPDWTGSEPAWVLDEGPFRVFPTPVPKFDLGEESCVIAPNTVTPSGGNIIVRRELVQRVGPFSTELGPAGHNLLGGEDVEWIGRALGKGATLRYVPDIRQSHYVDPERITMPYLLRKAFERSCSVVLFSPKSGTTDRIPAYLFRKMVSHAFVALFTLDAQKRRHFMLRVAATLGELKGFRKVAKNNKVRTVAQ
jgi:GT2 family glycosyltransferase